MNIKHILIIICIILSIFSVIDYNRHNYDINGFVFICNKDICEVRNRKANGKIKYIEKIDITKIEKFSSRLEKIPNSKNEGLVIYADCKDGTSFKLSPIYVRPSKYLETELIQPLNKALKQKPISINISFPN